MNAINALAQYVVWFCLITPVGCWVAWRFFVRQEDKRERFEAEWKRHFEPNLQSVAEHRQWLEADAQTQIDGEYVRQMNHLPDDHLPNAQKTLERNQ